MRKLPNDHWSYPLIALLAGVVMICRVVSTTYVFNHTIDEPYHIGSAVVLWEVKQLTVGAQHPPLARWVIGLPLVLQGVAFPEARGEYVVVEYPGFGIGRDLLFSGKLPYWRMLTAARHSLLIFAALALFYLYRLGRYLSNPLVAMLATVFFSVDPTFLAHSGLVGTDIAGCAGFIAGLYYLLRFIARPNGTRAAVAGVALALAISCKFTSDMLIPSLVVILIIRKIISRKHLPKLKWFAFLAIIAFFVLWATYGYARGPMQWQAMLVHEQLWTRLPEIVRQQPIPMPSFFLGHLFLASRALHGQASYLNGQITYTGWIGYFPEALLVKEPVGFLIALLIGIVIFIARPRSLRSILLLAPIVIYFAVSMRSRYQLGIRHLLPILPLMYLFAIMQFSRIRRMLPVIALIVLATIETAWIHPDYLAFFNFASGGPSRGERYLIDSNLDWGQDMARLATWLKSPAAQGRDYSIRCAYATEPLLRELGLNPTAMQGKPRGLFAVSKNVRHLLETMDVVAPGEDYSWLSQYPVVKRIGYSIDVYDLDAKDRSIK